jgi:hypothetical protein
VRRAFLFATISEPILVWFSLVQAFARVEPNSRDHCSLVDWESRAIYKAFPFEFPDDAQKITATIPPSAAVLCAMRGNDRDATRKINYSCLTVP